MILQKLNDWPVISYLVLYWSVFRADLLCREQFVTVSYSAHSRQLTNAASSFYLLAMRVRTLRLRGIKGRALRFIVP